ncbi:thiamine pyrophosphate-dependent enzyme [Lacisediminimonas profundi]|uniref:thiamine pyrophosphate-dependent enzyme n=1 Tax=Lacisediminimonas profundi TaxID=2603856 RepID=UPI00124B55E0|nr:thiamine pyrophosphate-dependent enzyme [Lacisediminimonas profundi]
MANNDKQATRDTARVMNRSDLTRRLVARLNANEAVIGGIGNNNFDLWASGQRPENFYMLGSMGLTAPIAMGVALAQPQRRVFALEGDGSLLMQLGALGTISAAKMKNLAVIVFDNGMYQITGKQPTLTSSTVDLVAVAKGAGLAQSAWAADEADFEALVDRALDGDGPWLIAARIDDQKPAGTTDRDPARIRQRFMAAMGAKA